MPMDENRQHIRPSILNRLIDYEPQVSRESAQHRLLGFEELKRFVIRDLERLLNTKGSILPVPPSCKEVNNSVFVYGLRDFTSQNPKSPSIKHQLGQDIEKTISKFEKRLKNVTVHIDTSAQDERNIKLKITGLLILDPVAEPVSFDTYFNINRGEYTIR